MARGISIRDVENKVQHISDNNVLPISTGADVPEVVTVGVLKEHIIEDVETAIEGKQDVINDLSVIRSGAALGATALQSESDPTVHAWAKEAQKPSYSYSEITGKPTLSTVATSGSYNDLTNKPDIPSEQIQSDWNQSNTSAKDYIKNKPEIPVLPTLADVATSGDYEDLVNTPTIPDVPEWAMASTKPSYTVSEIDGAQEELVSGTNIKTINNESILGSGNITIQGGGSGDVNVIESITFNGSAVPVDSSKNAAITYSAPVTSVNGGTGDVTVSVPTKVSDLTNDSGFITSYTETDPTVPSWAKATNKPSYTAAEVGALPDTTSIPTESTVSGWGFTKNAGTITGITMNGASKGTSGVVDLGTVITEHQSLTNYVQKSQTSGLLKNDGTVDTNAYITAASAPVTSVNGQTGAVSLSIPTIPSNIVTGTSSSYTIWVGTQAQYEAISTKDATTIYLITGS